VRATDNDSAGVLLARANLARYGLGRRVFVLRGDLLEPTPTELDLSSPTFPTGLSPPFPSIRSFAESRTTRVFATGDGPRPHTASAA